MTWFTRYGREYTGSHKIESINEAKGTASYMFEDSCGRCGGLGGAEAWRHTDWTCYECGGNGRGPWRTVKLYSAERLAKLVAADEKRQDKKQDKKQKAQAARDAAFKLEAEAKLAGFLADNREAIQAMRDHADRNEFLADLCEKLTKYGSLSVAQMEAAARAIAGIKAEATAMDCPSGRVDVSGVVIKTELRETKFGYVTKMLFRDDRGFKMWCSTPGPRPEPQQHLSFKVTLEPSETDTKFGFGTRPVLAKEKTA